MVMVGLGYLFFFEAMKIHDIEIRYDNLCEAQRNIPKNKGKDCIIEIKTTVDLKNPKLYYRLDKFYNNYRSYVKSKDIYQLSGKFKTVEMEKKCNGAESNADLVKNWLKITDLPKTMWNNTVQMDELAYPCG